MNISSSTFLFLFLPIVVGLYYLIPAKKSLTFRNVFLLLVSLVFYAWGEPVRIMLLIGMIAATWALGLLEAKHKKTKTGKLIVALHVLMNVAVLFIYKYVDFALKNIGYVTKHEFKLLGLALPLGLSFFVFQSISYIVDIYRGKSQAQKNPLNTALFLSVFFKITSGPIMQYNQFEGQLFSRRTTVEQFTDGVWRFIIGLGKKTIFAGTLAYIVSDAFVAPYDKIPVALAWLGSFAYMLQIYFDFSGYSDMALGLGKMFGFEIPENFNYPYISKSVAEYWQRWHITLGAWFRDYMYYPLTLGPAIRLRKKLTKKYNKDVAKAVQNIFTMSLIWATTGLWHGARWNYILWGVLNGAFAFWELYKKPMKNKKLEAFFGWAYTFALAFFTKGLVYTQSLSEAVAYYKAMFGLSGNALASKQTIFILREYWFFIIVGTICAFPVYKTLKEKLLAKTDSTKVKTALHIVESAAVLTVFVISLAYVVKGGFTAFIYQKF